MKKILPLAVLLLIHFTLSAQMDCRSTEYRHYLVGKIPGLEAAIQDIEGFTLRQLHKPVTIVAGTDHNRDGLSVITIPVVVHIVYNTSQENISDAQVQSQIDVLNRDYRKQNPDTGRIPSYYAPLATDCGFQFVLANLDTSGNPTTGIIRKHTNATGFAVNDDIKFAETGGDAAWDRDRYLNIWIGNLTGGILGYSSVPGCPKERDGVTLQYTAFGTMGTASAPFNLGRTATHEIGHWLNMIHVWGDAPCGDDEVADTPPQQAATYGNPSGIVVSCGNGPYGNMYMNYMDFTDDIGMHMFTIGQRNRMRTLFAEGGFRYALLSSTGASGIAVNTGSKNPSSAGVYAGGIRSVYPNPAVSAIMVTMNDASLIGSLLEIYNQVGQPVIAARITGLNMQLNVSSLTGGVYFVRVNDGKQNISYKLVKL